MITEIFMPKNGMDMQEGVIVRWLKEIGDPVEYEEPLLMIETDKITMESESPAKGTLLGKLYDEGDTVPVLTVIGYIGEPGDVLPKASGTEQPQAANAASEAARADETAASVSGAGTNSAPVSVAAGAKEAPLSASAPDGGERELLATPGARTLARERGVPIARIRPGRDGVVRVRDVERFIKGATPVARAVAGELGIDPADCAGTGFAGKVTKTDVLEAASPAAAGARPEAGPVQPAPAADAGNGAGGAVPMTGMRRTICRRMSSSHANVPPVTQNMRADVTELFALRERLNAGRERGERITLNDFVVKAVAVALTEFERFRMTLDGERFVTHDAVDVGVAVGVEEGLLVPVVRGADRLSLAQLSAAVKELAARAKAGKLLPSECGDARITVSNLGMYGVYSFTPIVNEPEASILGVCAAEDVPVLEEGKLMNRKKLMLSLTYDHRILNGAEVCGFEARVRDLLEDPYRLLV